MKFRDASNVLRTVKTIHIRDADNVSRVVKRVHIRDADNVSREMAGLAGAMAVIASPGSVYGAVNSHAPQRIYTNSTTATPTGGTPPYTYSWSLDLGVGWDITSPTSPTTALLSPSISPGDGGSTNATCTVTDSRGQIVDSNAVPAQVDNYGI